MLSSSILGKLYILWTQSAVCAFLRGIYRAFSRSFKNSVIVHWFVRDSRLEPIYRTSLFARIFKAIFDFFDRLLHAIWAAVRRAGQGSVTQRFVNRYCRSSFFLKFETVLGGAICLMFIVPHDYWSNSYALLFAVGLFGLYAILVGAGKRKLYYLHDMGFPILLFAIACVASLGFSYDNSDTIRILILYITAFLFLYVLSADVTTPGRMSRLLGFLYLAVIFTALYAFYQRVVGVAVSSSLTDLTLNKGVPGRVFSSFGNPNNYAEFLVMMAPLAAVFAASRKNRYLRLLLILGMALPFGALLMTYSRSCWISMLLCCIVFVYYADKKLLPMFFLLCLAAIPVLPESVMTRIGTLFNHSDSSNMFRLYIWQGTTQMARDYFPGGIGLGPGSFAVLYPHYANPHALIGVPHSHMVYLELVLELGLLGFVSYMWYMLRLWKDSACKLLHTHSKLARCVLIACLSSMIGIAFAFGVEYVWYYPRTFFTWFILAGIAVAAMRMSDEADAQTAVTES